MKSTLKTKVLVLCLLTSLVVFGHAQQETPEEKFRKAKEAVDQMEIGGGIEDFTVMKIQSK